ncbi:MAG: SDR family NAD(P)-dependent oxidoreductase [Eubacteriales bacterium]|nr:SDR family NAD(P)-dependent oxidoreductase [Eubacteriales bacterium]
MKVRDKVFVVTGGGNGVGRELVLNLLSRGARVAAVDINKPALEETVKLSGDKKDRLTTHIVNITDKEAVEALPDQIISQHGTVDGIINNAGIIQPFAGLNEIGYDIIERVMDVNFYGTLYMTKAFLPHLLNRPEANITNISSMGGLFTVPGQTIYGASKAGVRLLSEGLSSELKNTKIRVTVVIPGGIGSNIMNNSGAVFSKKMERLQKIIKITTPEKAAKSIVNGIEKNRYRFSIGIDAAVMDFICRISPNRGGRFLYQIMKSVLYD